MGANSTSRTEPTGHSSSLAARVLAAARARGLEDYLLERPLLLGLSGGADSLALLYVLYELRSPASRQCLYVAHLNHGFRGEEAQEDARFVADTAERLGLACSAEDIDVGAFAMEHHLSEEDAARRVRYAFLARIGAQHSAAVAVAHTADDQAETVLMHLLRGSGIGGLAGMRSLSSQPIDPNAARLIEGDLSPGRAEIYRPFLAIGRSEIDAYCAELELVPRNDVTNSDMRFRRNQVRHGLLPELERFSPGVKERLVRLADIARADDDALETVASAKLQQVTTYDMEARSVSFDREGLQHLPEGVQRRVVRVAIELLTGTREDVEFSHILTALDVILGGQGALASADLPHGLRVDSSGENPVIFNRSGEVDGALRGLIAGSTWPLLAPGQVQALVPDTTYTLEGSWALDCTLGVSFREPDCPGLLCAFFDAVPLADSVLYLRTRQPGDYIRPLGMSGRKSLQDLFVDAKIPWALRDRIAVIALSQEGGEVLWVAGPGGRRSGIAPLSDVTTQILRLQYSLEENT